MTKVEKLEEQIKRLNLSKNKILSKEKESGRKLMNKQKIIIGGFMLNKIKKMSSDQKINILDEIIKTIPEKRNVDKKAIENLI